MSHSLEHVSGEGSHGVVAMDESPLVPGKNRMAKSPIFSNKTSSPSNSPGQKVMVSGSRHRPPVSRRPQLQSPLKQLDRFLRG